MSHYLLCLLQIPGKVVLYLRDINLPKTDKYATSQVMAFLQQLLTYKGFYDDKLEYIGKDQVPSKCSSRT